MNVREDNFPEHKVQENLDDDGLDRRFQRNTFIFLGLALLGRSDLKGLLRKLLAVE
jgi:hypothetical protein